MENGRQPAFAAVTESYEQLGLTKREYFAVMAMSGLLARTPNRHNSETDLGTIECKRIAEESVIMADKLLKQLNDE